MGIPQTKPYLSVEEYYRLERASEVKHDYYNGEIFDMSGGTIVHSRITSNIIVALGSRLVGGPCGVYESNLRLRLASNGLRCYPDVSVFCGPLEIDPEDSEGETVTNPSVIFEVLSRSTEKYDRGFKSDSYREISSLKAFVLVSQNLPELELFSRQPDGSWLSEKISGLGSTLFLRSINIEMPVQEIYNRVDFSNTSSVVL